MSFEEILLAYYVVGIPVFSVLVIAADRHVMGYTTIKSMIPAIVLSLIPGLRELGGVYAIKEFSWVSLDIINKPLFVKKEKE